MSAWGGSSTPRASLPWSLGLLLRQGWVGCPAPEVQNLHVGLHWLGDITNTLYFINAVHGELISEMRELHDSNLAYLKCTPLNGFVFVARHVGNIYIDLFYL